MYVSMLRIPLFAVFAITVSPPLQVFTSPLPAAPGCSMPRAEDFVPEVPVGK